MRYIILSFGEMYQTSSKIHPSTSELFKVGKFLREYTDCLRLAKSFRRIAIAEKVNMYFVNTYWRWNAFREE